MPLEDMTGKETVNPIIKGLKDFFAGSVSFACGEGRERERERVREMHVAC